MTIHQHSLDRRIELGRSLLSRRKIYLDARYWIILRDTDLGLEYDVSARKLLHYLRRGVRLGYFVCPISADMFMELTKQRNTPTRRHATAALIDELSLGVAALNPQTLLAAEIHRFLMSIHKPGNRLHPMQEFIWTKVAYVLGDMYPTIANVAADVEEEIQRRAFDHLWNVPLTDIMVLLDHGQELSHDYRKLTEDTNAKNLEHRDELRSYKGTYDNELRGVIQPAGEIAADIIAEMESREEGYGPPPSAEERAVSINMCCNLLYEAMKRDDNRSALRTLHVTASIHAIIRWDKHRKVKVNDWHDFGHATLALTYCDVLLTEGSLHHLVSRPPLDLGKVNGCRIASGKADALAVVKTLAQPQTR